MRKLKCNLAAKITAWILSFLSFAVCVACVIGAVYMLDREFYTRTELDLQMHVERSLAQDIYSKLAYRYERHRFDQSDLTFEETVAAITDAKNWRYTLKDNDEKQISGNYKNEKATEYEFDGYFYTKEVWDGSEEQTGEKYFVSVFVLEDKTEVDQFLISEKLVHSAYALRIWIYAILLIAAIVFFSSSCFLISSAGHKTPDDVVVEGSCEKIPFDLFTVMLLAAAGLNYVILCICDEITPLLLIFAIPVLLFLDYALITLWLKNMIVNIKVGGFFKKLLSYRIICKVLNSISKVMRMGKGVLYAIICSSVSGAVLLVYTLLISETEMKTGHFFIWLTVTLLVFIVILYHTRKLKYLRDTTSMIASGNFSHTVNTDKLYGEMNALGKNINQINEGLQIAVSDKMKSERFKTELITNVSHDLKTPLTSIINYVDLLSKLELDNKEAQEYIEVLSRQSARLKKLTDDLLEASKASTGNIKMEFSRCDIGLLLSQTIGEFSDRLEDAQLIPIVTLPQTPYYTNVDGKRLYRVFENLMSNICKYSQPNTRVYLDVCESDGRITIRFRNISKEMLCVNGSELTERFVRGDSSRNTEGSGLGLSIAKSLTELQNGKFDIHINGDLFEVVVTFVKAELN